MPNLHTINPLRSIGSRIFVGFFLVLFLLAVIVGMVWRAAARVDDALRVDAISQGVDARISGVQIALLEARLRMAAYLQTENLVERNELVAAIDRLQALADMPDGLQGPHIAEVGTSIQPVRAALSNSAEAITNLRSATASLVAATAVLSNRGTMLAENAARLGDKALAEAGAAVLADVAQTTIAASGATATDGKADFDTAYAASAHGRQVLAAMDEASAGSARVQRLATAVRVAFESMEIALAGVQSAVSVRGERFTELTKTEQRAIDVAEMAIRSIATDRLERRTAVAAAQQSLRATVLETAIGASLLGIVIALGLGLSITRPLSRLAGTMRELADGTLNAAVPHAAARDEVGALAGAVVAIKDRSDHLATHDALTDLPNRILFHESLDRALAWSRREDAALAILYIDLDHFKDVNDTLGHATGDQLLMQVASRLSASIRQTDTLARLGGDEFAIVHICAQGVADSEMLAERVIEVLTEPFEIDGHSISVGTSIGIAVRSEADLKLLTADAQLLLQEADVALYQAKEHGRGVYCFYEAEMNARLLERRSLEDDIREGLKNDQFELYYQPQFDVAGQRISGAEALIRWRHPRRGNVSPTTFIPVAEQTGLILQIGGWVLCEACRQAAAWPDLARMAVNVSAVQFRRPGFFDLVSDALAQANLEPARLELEITEGVLLTETDETLTTLQRLRKMGIVIAMDDFGTGYSSLGYLRKFRFDKIKIDQSFVSRMRHDPESEAIVRAVLRMGHAMGIRVNAEGVEHPDQMQLLRDEGCEEVQGYLFGRPMPAGQFSELLGHPVHAI